MLWKLFHRACFALALIALAGDIESNPGYPTLDDIRNTRGLNSFKHTKSRTRLEGIDSKTVDILTLSETSLVMPLFEYADLVWGDKHNITLMSSLQVLQNKAAKVILNRPLCSSSIEALAVLKWQSLEKRRFQRRCVHVYKCINGLINHDLDLIRQDVLHRHNTRNKGNFRLPRVKRNWGKQRTQYHAVSDFNSLSHTIKDSRNVNSFKRNVFKFLI